MIRSAFGGSIVVGSFGTKTAKKPPPNPPARARGRSIWPAVLSVKKDRPPPRPARYRLRRVSLWPSKTGKLVMVGVFLYSGALPGPARGLGSAYYKPAARRHETSPATQEGRRAVLQSTICAGMGE